MMANYKARDILDVCDGFFRALMQARMSRNPPEHDWREFVAHTWKEFAGWPAVPLFTKWEVTKTSKVPGMDPDVHREVEVRLFLAPMGEKPMRWVEGTIRVQKESAPYKPDAENGTWGVVPTSWRPKRG